MLYSLDVLKWIMLRCIKIIKVFFSDLFNKTYISDKAVNSIRFKVGQLGIYALCMVFHVRWIFLTTRLRVSESETSSDKSISHGKPYKMRFLAYFIYTSRHVSQLNTLLKVENHENHVSWIYLTTVLYMGKVTSMREIWTCWWIFNDNKYTQNYFIWNSIRYLAIFSAST